MNRRIAPLSLTLLASLLCLAEPLSAQPRRPGGAPGGTVSGIVMDATAAAPLANATVALRNASDSSLVTGAIADKDGGFSIAGIRPGKYYARVSFVGYLPRLIPVEVTAGNPRADLGRIELAVDNSLGNEVSVTAKREFMTIGIDRTSYQTDDLAVASGGNATDLLRNIPSIEVDADGRVSLRGNQQVAIQINGRPMVLSGDGLAAFLRGLPADAVERVEVVTNPSAKYDPEGMGGIINIVLDQQTSRGLSGSVNGALSTTGNHNAGLSLSYGTGPLNLFGSYSFNRHNREGTGDRYRESLIPGTSPIIEQRSENDNASPSHMLNTSVDYSTGGSTFSLSSIISRRDGGGISLSSTSERDAERVLTRRYERRDQEEEESLDMDYRLGYKLVVEPSSHELTSELRYSRDVDEELNAYTQSNLALDGAPGDSLPQRQNVTQDDEHRNYALQVDYVRPLWAGSRLEAGYLGEIESTGGDFFSESFDYGSNVFRADEALNNSFDYERRIHAVYGTLGQEIGNFGVQAGVRLEQANTTFNQKTLNLSVDNNYFSVFPSAFLTYKANDAVQLKASYSKRVQRPWIRALNPFVTMDDPQFRRSGNPNLKPEYTDSYEMGASYFAEMGSLTLTPFYRRTTDALRRWELVDSVGISTISFVNFDINETYGVDLVGTIRVSDWLNALASFSGYQTVTDASNIQENLGSDGFVWTARANATVNLPLGFDVQGSVFYRAPMVIEGGEIRPWTMVDLSVQKKILEDKGKIGLRVSDPFNAQGFGLWRRDPRFYQTFEHKWNSRALVLTFSYNFGNADQMRRRPQGGGQPGGGGAPDMMGM